jgi:gliding motility-associated-like protein
MSILKLKPILTIFLLLVAVLTNAQVPTANFTAVTSSGCSPLVVDFRDQSTGNPTSWFWDFGNGATSTLRNPSTTYFKEGSYTVKLTVTNAQGSNSLVRTDMITVFGKPVANFTVDDSTGCFPVRSQFTDLSTASSGTTNTAWFWDFGDGSQSSEQNPMHAYTGSGNFTVTFRVTNDKGCFATFSKPAYIKVSSGVRAAFTNTTAAVCKPPFSIAFNNTSSGPGNVTYYWDFGDGTTSTAGSPQHVYTTTGNFTVKLAATSTAGCSDTSIKTDLFKFQNIASSILAPDGVCVNDTATFKNTSTPSPVSSVWDFGDGSKVTATDTVKVYTTPNTYTVKLYNNYGYCTDSASKTINIFPRPKAGFTAPSTIHCQPPFTVTFQDQSANGVSWQWDFGDGSTSTLQNPTHTYTDFGKYTVKLIVTNSSGCTDTLKKDSLIKVVKPVITIPSLPTKGCIPLTISPVASVVTLDNVTSYLWDFGDGGTSTAARPTHTYTNQGTYDVKLTVTTSTGCTETYTVQQAVKVGRIPTVNFNAVPNPVCAFQPVQFTNLTNESDEWNWDFGDGSVSNLENPQHVFVDTGRFSITLTAINNGCPRSLSMSNLVRVKPPIARFNVQANCNNRLQYTFVDQSVGATTWLWDFGDGTTSTQPSPTHTYPAYKTYSVTLTVTNSTCTNSITNAVKVFNEKPSFRVSDTVACKPATIQFKAVVADTTNFAIYLWDFGDGNQWNSSTYNSGSGAYHLYSASGWYNLTLTTTDIYGCQLTVAKPKYIRINGPSANFTASNVDGCEGITTTFNDFSKDDGLNKIKNWQWNFGDGTVKSFTQGPFQHTYATAGTYSVKLTVKDSAGCTDTMSLQDLVHATNPLVSFDADTVACPGSLVRFTNTSTALNYTTLWSLGDGTTTPTFSPTHTYADTGHYTIKLTITDQYGCMDSLVKPGYVNVDRPIASFTVSDSVSSCPPLQVQFTNTSHFINSFVWDLDGSPSALPNPVKFFVSSGTYPIQLAVTSPGGCTDTVRKSIRIFDTVGSKITYIPLNGCKPLSVDFTTYSPGPVSYTWDFGDGVILNNSIDTLNHIYDFFGDFVPKIIMTDPSGCEIPVTGHDTIHIIGATAKFGLDKSLFCDSGLITITDSTTYNDSLVSYHWNFGDGTSSSLQNPGTHFYSSSGLYTVTLNVKTQNNCLDTFAYTYVRVVQSPSVAITGDSVICLNDSMQHLGVFLQPDTSVVGWQWLFPNGNTSTLQNPALQQYTTAGNFVVTSIATNSSGCKDTAAKNILIHPLPVVTMPPTLNKQAGFPLTIPATYSSNVESYTWAPASTLSCTDCPQPETHTKFNAKYTVAFQDSNGCKNTGQIQVIVVCPNSNVFVPNTFSPNGDGMNDVLYVRGKGLDRVKSLRIFNRWGELVFEQNDFPVNNSMYGWNGTYKGQKPHPDVYVYQIEVFCENSEIIRFEGNVALIQ